MLAAIEEMGLDTHLAVNTAWCGFSLKRAMAGVGILGYFRTRTYSSDAQLAKPDPAFFKLVERRARIEGARIVYVGDDIEYDIKGAKAVGWSAALRLNKDNRKDAHLADYAFNHSRAGGVADGGVGAAPGRRHGTTAASISRNMPQFLALSESCPA